MTNGNGKSKYLEPPSQHDKELIAGHRAALAEAAANMVAAMNAAKIAGINVTFSISPDAVGAIRVDRLELTRTL